MRTGLLMLAACAFACLSITAVFAQASTPVSSGISVTPSIVRLDLATDQPNFIVTYKNMTASTIQLSFHAQDFSPLENGWKINYLSEKDAQNYKYSLSSWLEFEKTTLTILPNETDSVKVFVNNSSLPAGAHYGMILAEISQESNKGNVAIHAILSSLVFVRTNTGNEIESGQVEGFQGVRDYLALPHQYTFQFKNAGNVDLTPYGTVTLTDWLGRTIGRVVINEASLTTLPESIRRYDVKAKTTAHMLLPGPYKATLSLHYGKTNKTITTSSTIFSLGSLTIKEVVLSIIGLFAIVIVARKIKRKKP